VRRRRNIEAFSLSFLDCICCGFGAIILLLVLSKIYEPVIIEKTQDDLESLIALLQQELVEIRGETTVINRDLESVRTQTSATKLRLARLQGELNTVQGQYAATQSDSEAVLSEGALRTTKQRLTEEMRRLQPYFRRASNDAIAGIPADSEYIIFIIDTSGSMQQLNWDRAIEKLTETLDVYPQVKGIQIMNDNGNFMFKQYAQIDAVNRVGKDGKRMVRIHAVGFPLFRPSGGDIPVTVGPVTVGRFAQLMRILCDRNGGTFVALSRDRS